MAHPAATYIIDFAPPAFALLVVTARLHPSSRATESINGRDLMYVIVIVMVVLMMVMTVVTTGHMPVAACSPPGESGILGSSSSFLCDLTKNLCTSKAADIEQSEFLREGVLWPERHEHVAAVQ